MPFADRQNRLNTKTLARFGAPVLLNGVTVQGDYSAPSKEREIAGVWVAAADPACTVLTSDVPAAPVGKPFVNAASEAFTVQDLKSDGCGLTVLILQKGL